MTTADRKSTLSWDAAYPLPAAPGYEVQELVGRGGMGCVYRARQTALGRTVALKLLACDPHGPLLARFRDEARAVARLQHPNIAQVFESGVADGRPYYTQEFLEGGSLAASLGGRPLDPREAASLLEVVCRAVQHSHEQGILHRDLKPANILLTADGTPKVTDFGLAKTFRAKAEGDTAVESRSGLTRTGEVLGTPAYMPPEQASGVVAAIGPAADVYGLGAILYELLTGRPPFQAPDALQTLLLVLTMEPVPPRTLQPALPLDLDTICLKCLEKNPRRRYLSAQALGDDLRRFLEGEPITARPVGRWERAAKWARRNRAAAALIGVSAAAGVLLAGAAIALTAGFFQLREANRGLETYNTQLEQANAEVSAKKLVLEVKSDELGKAHQETSDTLEFTLKALDRYFFDFSDELFNTPGAEFLRRKILDEARAALDQLSRQRPTDLLVRRYQAEGYYKLGAAEDVLGRPRASAEALERARALYETLMDELPAAPEFAPRYALCTLMLANKYWQLQEAKQAILLRNKAFRLADELLTARPNDVEVLRLADDVQFTLYGLALRDGLSLRPGSREQQEKDKAAEAALRAAIDHCRRMVELQPASTSASLHLIDRELSLAAWLMATGRASEAEPLVVHAREVVVDRMPEKPSLRVRVLAAAVWSSMAQLHASQNKPAEAEVDYLKAVGMYEKLAADFSNSPLYPFQAARAWLFAGNSARDDGRANVAQHHYSQALGLLQRLTRDHPTNQQYQENLKVVEQLLREVT